MNINELPAQRPYLDMVGVVGSIPIAPTNEFNELDTDDTPENALSFHPRVKTSLPAPNDFVKNLLRRGAKNPAPKDWWLIAPTMTELELQVHYSCSRTPLVRWRRATNIGWKRGHRTGCGMPLQELPAGFVDDYLNSGLQLPLLAAKWETTLIQVHSWLKTARKLHVATPERPKLIRKRTERSPRRAPRPSAPISPMAEAGISRELYRVALRAFG